MRVSSDLPTTVLPFSLNSTGIVAACAVLMRSIPCLRPSRDLVGEVFHHRKHRVGGGLPQPAYGCVHHRLEKFTIAAEPMKQPYWFSVSKSSGISPIAAGRIPPEAPPGR